MPQEASSLFCDLIKKYQHNPQGIMEEYNDIYKAKERFIRYSGNLFGILAFALFFFGMHLLRWVWISVEIKYFSIPFTIFFAILIIILTVRAAKFSNMPREFSKYSMYKDVYEQAYIRALNPTQFGSQNKTKGLRSKWFLVRVYSKWKLFNFPGTIK